MARPRLAQIKRQQDSRGKFILDYLRLGVLFPFWMLPTFDAVIEFALIAIVDLSL